MKIEYLTTPPLLSREKKKEKCIKGNENRYSGRQDHGTCRQRNKRNHQENTTTCLYKIVQLSAVVYSWPPAFLDFAAPAFSYPFLHLHRPPHFHLLVSSPRPQPLPLPVSHPHPHPHPLPQPPPLTAPQHTTPLSPAPLPTPAHPPSHPPTHPLLPHPTNHRVQPIHTYPAKALQSLRILLW